MRRSGDSHWRGHGPLGGTVAHFVLDLDPVHQVHLRPQLAGLQFLGEGVQLHVIVADSETSHSFCLKFLLDLELDLILVDLGQHVGPEVKQEGVPVLLRHEEAHLVVISEGRLDPLRGRFINCFGSGIFMEMDLNTRKTFLMQRVNILPAST